MRARGIFLVHVALSPFAIHAFDHGLDLMDSSTFVSDGTTLTQQNRATAWFSAPIGSASSLYLSGFYEFKGSFATSGITMTPWRLDASRNEYVGTLSGAFVPLSLLHYSVGRIFLSDFSGWLLSGLYDGGRLQLSLGNTTVALSFAYTGLLDKDDALLGPDSNDNSIAADPTRYFAPRRLFVSLGDRWIEALPGQDLGFEAWGQADLEHGLSGTRTAYLEPFIEGHVGRTFTWRAWTAGEAIIAASPSEALAAGALARITLRDLLNLRLTSSLAWSSGMAGGLAPFTPLRLSALDVLTGFTFSNIATASLDLAVSPFSWLSTTFHGGAVFRTSNLIIDSTQVRGDASGMYLGSEASVQALIPATTDLNFNGTAGVFIPNTNDYFKSGTPLRATATVYADFAM